PQASARIDGSPDLVVKGIAEIRTRQWSHLSCRVKWIAAPGSGQCVGNALLECFSQGLDDDEALGRDAALAAVDQAGSGADVRGGDRIRVAEDDVRVAAAEFHDGLPEGCASDAAKGAAGLGGAGQGDAADVGVSDHGFEAARIDEEHAKDTGRKTRLAKD